ncbi:MAG: hypothetical protein Q7T68_05355 [Sphingopyxis sp.]|nr:hypothetical protein [Sphingopyxis sp.]
MLEWFQIVAHVCTVIALVALFIQMKFDSDSRRVSQALGYIAQLNSEPMAGHRENLDRTLLPFLAELQDIKASGGADRLNADRVITEAFHRHDVRGTEIPARLSVVQLTQFYDQILVCRAEDICDASVIDANVGPQIVEFWNNYESFIGQARNAGTTGLGDAVKRYVGARSVRKNATN